jgi:hypothetical protein
MAMILLLEAGWLAAIVVNFPVFRRLSRRCEMGSPAQD